MLIYLGFNVALKNYMSDITGRRMFQTRTLWPRMFRPKTFQPRTFGTGLFSGVDVLDTFLYKKYFL